MRWWKQFVEKAQLSRQIDTLEELVAKQSAEIRDLRETRDRLHNAIHDELMQRRAHREALEKVAALEPAPESELSFISMWASYKRERQAINLCPARARAQGSAVTSR